MLRYADTSSVLVQIQTSIIYKMLSLTEADDDSERTNLTAALDDYIVKATDIVRSYIEVKYGKLYDEDESQQEIEIPSLISQITSSLTIIAIADKYERYSDYYESKRDYNLSLLKKIMRGEIVIPQLIDTDDDVYSVIGFSSNAQLYGNETTTNVLGIEE